MRATERTLTNRKTVKPGGYVAFRFERAGLMTKILHLSPLQYADRDGTAKTLRRLRREIAEECEALRCPEVQMPKLRRWSRK